jgi:hypothetical protein
MIDSPAIGAITANSFQDPPVAQTVDRTPTPAPVTAQDDQASLSPIAQAILLRQSGMNVAEIANQLEIPVNAVLGDLGIAIPSVQTKAAVA